MRTKMVEKESESMTIKRQCTLLSVSRTSIYYTPAINDHDKVLMDRIDELFTEDPTRGTRRIRAALNRKFGINIGRSKIKTLMLQMGIHAIYRAPGTSIPNDMHKKYPYLLRGLKIDHVNQVWSTDITYIRLNGGFVYLCAVIDWYSRYVLSWRLSTSLETLFCKEALEDAIRLYGTPEIFNTDQGSQFTSTDFTSVLLQKNIKISMDGKGRALDNVFVERLWRTVKYENVYIRGYGTVKECRSGLSEFFEHYNTKREHSALLYNYPADIYFGSVQLPVAA
jgi:putative transposase